MSFEKLRTAYLRHSSRFYPDENSSKLKKIGCSFNRFFSQTTSENQEEDRTSNKFFIGLINELYLDESLSNKEKIFIFLEKAIMELEASLLPVVKIGFGDCIRARKCIYLANALVDFLNINEMDIRCGTIIDEYRERCYGKLISELKIKLDSMRESVTAFLNKRKENLHYCTEEVKLLKGLEKEGVEIDIPRAFICPISHKLMSDPVLCILNGETYERAYAHEMFFNTKKPDGQFLIENKALRIAIEDFCARTVKQNVAFMPQ